MSRYLFQRLVATLISLVGATAIAFFASRLAPGDPIRMMTGDQNVPVEVVQQLQRRYGLDQPILTQYVLFMKSALVGDFGTSYYYIGKPVTEVIAPGIMISLQWQVVSLAIAVFGALALGIVAAIKQNTWLDYLTMFIALAGISLPSFALATFLIVLFSLQLGWLPVAGIETPAHFILPCLVMAAQPMALLARLVRASMLEVMYMEYMTTARAKGLAEFTVILRHGLKNALLPSVTVLGIMVGRVMAGAFLVETIFSIPGLGRIGVQAVIQRDYPVILGITVLLSVAFLAVTFIVDALYGLLDPRIRVT
jgi:ABC-type dipeptide/oligopeptide/nickel transport system permease component